MASIVTYIDVRAGAATVASRFALAEARRVADEMGATVYALLLLGPIATDTIDAVAGELGRSGADRILCCSDAALNHAAIDPSHGRVLTQIAERLRPALFLFPAGSTSAQLAPPLAVRCRAVFMPHATVDICAGKRGARSRLLLRRWRAAFDCHRVVDLSEWDGPVVATLMAGTPPHALGEPAAEVDMTGYPAAPGVPMSVLSEEPDPLAGLDLASSMVLVDEPADAVALAGLRSALPANAQVLDKDDPRRSAIAVACPSSILVVAPAGISREALPRIAPGATLGLVMPKGADKGNRMPRLLARPQKSEPLGGLLSALKQMGQDKEPQH